MGARWTDPLSDDLPAYVADDYMWVLAEEQRKIRLDQAAQR